MPKNTLHIKNIDIQTTHIMLKTDINCDIKPFIQNQREIILNEIKEKYSLIDEDYERYKNILEEL